MSTSDFAIRPMTRSDLELALDWAAEEGWNPGLHDAEPFLAADPHGFFLGELKGKPVGAFSAVAYDERFGFAGLFLVRPELRGHRYGVLLGRAGMDYLGSRNVGLDGVVAKLSNYQHQGFHLAYRTIRWGGRQLQAKTVRTDPACQVVGLKQLPLDDLAGYDRTAFPALRRAFLETWIRQPGTIALGLVRNDRLTGYGVARPCRAGYKLGPLFADDPASADTLLQSLVTPLAGESFYLDVPEPNQAGAALVKRHGLEPVFETARMYSREVPPIDLARVFGVTSLELG